MQKFRIDSARGDRLHPAGEGSIITIAIVCCACAIVLVLAVAIAAA